MSVVDSAMTREVLRDISKRPVDISQLSVHVTRGVVYLQGRVERLRDHYQQVDLTEEMHIICRLLKQKPGIRDVCCEVDMTDGSHLGHEDNARRRAHY